MTSNVSATTSVRKRSTYARAVQIEGLAELQRDLRAIDAALPKELTRANRDAAQLVADRARMRAMSLGGVAAKTAPSIRALAEQRYAKLVFGGARYPFAFGANFGAEHDVLRDMGAGGRAFGPGRKTVFGRKMFQKTLTERPPNTILGWNQFPEYPFGDSRDRFIYWTINHMVPEPFMSSYEKAIDRVAEAHGFSRTSAGFRKAA